MFWIVLLGIGCAALMRGAHFSAQEDVPYIYYYSRDDQAFMSTRADGNDQEVIIPFTLQEEYLGELGIYGDGWSASGELFAWIVRRSEGGPSIANDLYVYAEDGTEVDTLSFETQTVFSPFGHAFQLAFFFSSQRHRVFLRSYGTLLFMEVYPFFSYLADALLGDFTWGQYDLSLYSSEVQQIISQGANRTFGSTEFNNLTDESQHFLINNAGWVAFYGRTSNIAIEVDGALFGVFLMTPSQHANASSLPKRTQ